MLLLKVYAHCRRLVRYEQNQKVAVSKAILNMLMRNQPIRQGRNGEQLTKIEQRYGFRCGVLKTFLMRFMIGTLFMLVNVFMV